MRRPGPTRDPGHGPHAATGADRAAFLSGYRIPARRIVRIMRLVPAVSMKRGAGTRCNPAVSIDDDTARLPTPPAPPPRGPGPRRGVFVDVPKRNAVTTRSQSAASLAP